MSNKPTGWEVWETIGVSIPNPRPCIRIPKPDWMSPEEFEKFADYLEKEAAKKDAEDQAKLEKGIRKVIEDETDENEP